MAQVVVERDSDYAPCCYLICKVDNRGEWDTRDESRTILVQTDWDYPSLASCVGYVCCDCGDTDGTIDCAHKTAGRMITEAAKWLNNHLGEPFDDPGYFEDNQ